jgi:hypothetical protein
MRQFAIDCNSLQNRKKQTQNPPRATSWGFDPPPGTIYLVYLQELIRDESILADSLRYKYGTASIRFIFSGLRILAHPWRHSPYIRLGSLTPDYGMRGG